MFEQPGVANIRERKAARDNARYLEQQRRDNPEQEPPKGTLEYLVWLARKTETPEDKARRIQAQLDFSRRMREEEQERIERHRCKDCGADTINYSHSFHCPWRGSGF